MNIRRPVAALFLTLAVAGGSASLTACGDPSGLDRNDGDVSDNDTENTDGADPGDESQGNLPDVDDDPDSDEGNESRDEDSDG
ncbi:hypothetical protein [Modestobacter italicus]|uniref:hypothetical protein n=1 Tax=Modestobacter italicus (strain DSM 44449 / CECT 9708 / BC 501) TaxID=2732864 RepID=UPI001C976136|nr:hypothetical protein [Modestobacter italicus]